MGAWGHGPLDNDAALDWLGEHVTDPVGHEVENLLDKFGHYVKVDGVVMASDQYGYELRAAADVVLKLNFFSDTLFPRLHERLADALKLMRYSSWVDEWAEPAKIKDSLDRQIRALREGQKSTTLLENLG